MLCRCSVEERAIDYKNGFLSFSKKKEENWERGLSVDRIGGSNSIG